MKYSGLYFIPTSTNSPADSSTTLNALIPALESAFHTLSRTTPWSLTYRLFRDTPPRSDPSSDTPSYAHTYQHFLTLSSLSQNRAYVHLAPPPSRGPGTVAALPAQQSEAQALLLRNQLAALWSPRHTLSVQNGATYAGGLFTVQIGELRALREGQSGGVSSPGVLVCISTVAGIEEGVAEGNGAAHGAAAEEDEVDFGFAQATIREFWEKLKEGRDLGRSEVKAVLMVPKGRGLGEEEEAAVRMWCEVLRLRG
ncbi:uncharacterized protein EKO05_0011263 [Ascochyta rabiei]|uniref:Mediator of RNA polymerase II transcription subunit 20 n=1 Tax=Didymella rabiei TaxID=5454 RepID=A0A163E515_DIDRA|nr:uncharacterized protein EKO05_0011263 [Ascochyta rabiei]KZM23524.1 RNA polymerase II transcription cofactor [Ascochyta rabiei]UPX21057.1 hypothetical protein EKO05_0011263 [Ascochyta rabiei]